MFNYSHYILYIYYNLLNVDVLLLTIGLQEVEFLCINLKKCLAFTLFAKSCNIVKLY